MDTIIGLGKSGCAIAVKFAEYPQYKIYKIDVGLLRYLLEPVSQVYLNCQHLELDVCAEI